MGYVDLSIDTMHLKVPLVRFGLEGSALTLPLFLLSPIIITPFHCSSTMTKDHLLGIFYGTKWPFCADVPLNPHSFILGEVQRQKADDSAADPGR